MEFRTIVDVAPPAFRIEPFEEMLFVGSCFAQGMGRRFAEEQFRATVNPFGTMYNPASVLHTVDRYLKEQPEARPQTVFLTLGTNHVYRLKETGEIVDNCEKRPQRLFAEEQLSVEACAGYLRQAVDLLRQRNGAVNMVLTVSPIRYRKYGYHESQLSKAVLLMAVERLQAQVEHTTYFPAYEIVLDELRDYRFYAPDMLHPSEQAVDYIWQRLSETYLSEAARRFVAEWKPLKAVLSHKPFHPESAEYQELMGRTMAQIARLKEKYCHSSKL